MIIDGKKIAENILNNLSEKVKKLKEKGINPHLVIILVGDDPASKAYVRQKEIKANLIGAKTTIYRFTNSIEEKKLLNLLEKLNTNPKVHGIIVQRPLPLQINNKKVDLLTNLKKDIDAFHPKSKFTIPITCAVLTILENVCKTKSETNLNVQSSSRQARTINYSSSDERREESRSFENSNFTVWLKSKNIVIIGKGETGGRPIITTLRKMKLSPEIIDSKTKNPQDVAKNADILISAVGKQNVIRPEMVKQGAILISIGLRRGEDGKLHGDYDEEKIKNIASFYTPTPGGVGPVNVACLLENLILAAEN